MDIILNPRAGPSVKEEGSGGEESHTPPTATVPAPNGEGDAMVVVQNLRNKLMPHRRICQLMMLCGVISIN